MISYAEDCSIKDYLNPVAIILDKEEKLSLLDLSLYGVISLHTNLLFLLLFSLLSSFLFKVLSSKWKSVFMVELILEGASFS